MSRYIDADNLQRHGNRGGIVYWRDIEAQPTADVVEVGKCKDCVHHGSFLPWCKIFEKRMNDDDYCSRFERK